MLVERVDQGDEAGRLVAVLGAHARDADEDHGVIAAGDGEIVGGAARLAAEPLEGEDGDALQALRHVQRPAAGQLQLLGRHPGAVLDRIIGEAEEGLAQRRGRLRPVRHVPGRHAAEPLQPVIGRAVQRHDLQLRLDQVDEGQEQLAVEAAEIEVAGRPVRGGDRR